MALNLKSGRTYTDDSLVNHSNAYFAVDKAVFENGKILFTCKVWKDETTFLASLTNPAIQPVKEGMHVIIEGANFVTYFMTPNADGIVPLAFMNDVFYNFLTTEKPPIESLDYDDWEEDMTLGVPATRPGDKEKASEKEVMGFY